MFIKTKPDAEVLKHEVIRLAAALGLKVVEDDSRRAGHAAYPGASDAAGAVPQSPRPDRFATAIAWIHALAVRDGALGEDLFADPAWHILLDLYVHHCRHQTVSVSSLCLASKVPATTALRWIALLEERGLIRKWADPKDRRRAFVSLTTDGRDKLEYALDKAAEDKRKPNAGRLPFMH